ncbi:MAG: RdgB/HAM1 family non-canonical purine NTP pyrophosphatase [Thermoplasmata archaeon]|nr:MAG: RdgB/HAM1 family non-canonical purine NTP pyrophosphatase [Thermoplasmata archaeon]
MGDDSRVLRVVTSNEGKAREFAVALERVPWRVERVAMEYQEVQADTLDAVALDSARWLLDHASVGPPFVLEDAGLFIDALSGFPGVYSAYVFRTVGCQGIIDLMSGRDDRSARFESRIALVLPGGTVEVLRGTCQGRIPDVPRGTGGFGFDPVFVPEGAERTFAEMGLEEKEGHSHRGKALAALRDRLAML